MGNKTSDKFNQLLAMLAQHGTVIDTGSNTFITQKELAKVLATLVQLFTEESSTSDSLITRVTALESNDNSTLVSRVSSLESKLTDLTNTTNSKISSLQSSVTSAQSSITSLTNTTNTKFTSVESSITTVKNSVTNLITYGSNSNGKWWKFSVGGLILQIPVERQITGSPSSNTSYDVTLPTAFSNSSYTTLASRNWNYNSPDGYSVTNTNQSSSKFRINTSPMPNGNGDGFKFLAIGW